jgi:hypothetical protein
MIMQLSAGYYRGEKSAATKFASAFILRAGLDVSADVGWRPTMCPSRLAMRCAHGAEKTLEGMV